MGSHFHHLVEISRKSLKTKAVWSSREALSKISWSSLENLATSRDSLILSIFLVSLNLPFCLKKDSFIDARKILFSLDHSIGCFNPPTRSQFSQQAKALVMDDGLKNLVELSQTSRGSLSLVSWFGLSRETLAKISDYYILGRHSDISGSLFLNTFNNFFKWELSN